MDFTCTNRREKSFSLFHLSCNSGLSLVRFPSEFLSVPLILFSLLMDFWTIQLFSIHRSCGKPKTTWRNTKESWSKVSRQRISWQHGEHSLKRWAFLWELLQNMIISSTIDYCRHSKSWKEKSQTYSSNWLLGRWESRKSKVSYSLTSYLDIDHDLNLSLQVNLVPLSLLTSHSFDGSFG